MACEKLRVSILVATLLNNTSGSLQQHLRLNVRTLDTYYTVRNVTLDYYQSRHAVKSETPTPVDISVLWKKGKKSEEWDCTP